MKSIIFTPILTLFLLTTLGCGVRPPLEGRRDPYESPQITFASNDLKHQTAVGDPKVSHDSSGLLVVTIPIRSEIDKDLHIDYQVTFLDANGHKLQDTGWYTKHFTSKVPDEITVTSMSPQAADFRIRFRWAR
jgi:hypothetical protein